MRVVLTTNGLAAIGGAEWVLARTALCAKQHGYDVAVCVRCPPAPGSLPLRDVRLARVSVSAPPRLPLLAIAALLTALSTLGMMLYPLYLAYKREGPSRAWVRLRQELHYSICAQPVRAILDWSLRRRLGRLHRDAPIDVIHAHRTDQAMCVVAAWADQNCVPMLCHDHSGLPGERHLRQPPCQYSEGQIAAIARHCTVVVLSELLVPRALAAYGCGARIVALPNWAVAASPTPAGCRDQGPTTVVTVARLVEGKGLETLLQAMDREQMRSVDLRCLIVGDGPLRSALEREIGARGLRGRVSCTGPLPPEGVRILLSRASIMVLASEDEGLPLVILEAMAAALPVVATPVGAIPDLVVHGETGLLVPVGDETALREAVATLAADRDLRVRMGAAGRRLYSERYSEEAVWPQLEALYCGLRGREGGDT